MLDVADLPSATSGKIKCYMQSPSNEPTKPTFQLVTNPSTQLHFSLWRIAVPQTMTLREDLGTPAISA
ncbi:hypothetical protein CEXT_294701 [Caerostris extrusa]|uniref:Uncharacterized protein n=1 Tax=Caerostris extrusa TaxID=172846 RepID=A0AAV4PBU4_CAEEX|nr:hypothetical protein CEXT_294701 [Caerostris extrusa]